MDPEQCEITQLLSKLKDGDAAVTNRLLELLYDELHRIARSYLTHGGSATLQPTVLVHEAYLHLMGQNVDWQNKAHFASIAARIMRRIVVDHARARKASKRGGVSRHEAVTPAIVDDRGGQISFDDLLAVNQALERLGHFGERQSRIVELRFFGGLSVDEIACVLAVDRRTVQRDWKVARAWLHRELKFRANG